jgi:hypothetical protein
MRPSARTLALSLLFGCSPRPSTVRAEQPSGGHELRTAAPSAPLKDRTAQAWLAIDTGGDQMVLERKTPRLRVLVRYQSKTMEQMLASCAEPSMGSALGGGTERELEVAFCEGEFWLIAEPGAVLVEDRSTTPARVVAKFQLPWPEVRAVKPP